MTENSALPDGHFVGCSCPTCSGAHRSEPDNTNNPDAIITDAPSTTATKEQFGTYLTDGYWQAAYGQYGPPYSTANFQGWTDTTLTFSIGNWYSAAEKSGIRDAFAQWSQVTNLTFTEVASGGQIYFDTPGSGETSRAFAQTGFSFSGGNATIVNPVRIVIDYDSGGFGSDPTDLGNYALMTAIHEIGHAIGLGHSGWYNAGQGNPTYASDAQWLNDTRQYSLMSYWDASNSGANHQYEYASTPLLMDIYAIQTLYGANTSTRSGNTVYGFNSTAGSNQFNFTVNVKPVVAIWDGGGTDTLDLSGYSNNQKISLIEGDFMNVGGSTGNVVIAYGAVIENAIGGSGNDSIYGNTANNILNGGLGNDTFYGSTGSDTLDGDGGTDTAIYSSYNIADFLVSLIDSVTVTLQNIASLWTDTITEIENFIFNGSNYTFAQVSALAQELETVSVRFDYNLSTTPVFKNKNFKTDGVTNVTEADLAISGNATNAAQITQTFGEITIANANTTGHTVERVSYFDLDIDTVTINNFKEIYISLAGATDALALDFNNIQRGQVFAGSGDDNIGFTVKEWQTGQTDYVKANLGDGADTILVNGTHTGLTATINGGNGNDDIRVFVAGNHTIHGDAGNDYVSVLAGNDKVYGDAGDDRLYGGAGNDNLYGGDDNDQLYGGDGIDNVFGEAGNDTLYGEAGADFLQGGSGTDTLYGGDDNDTLRGDIGNDTLWGGNGDDRLLGDGGGGEAITGDDILYGEAGNDALYGGAGNDELRGGDGNDKIYGDIIATSDTFTGDDTIYGDAGNDQLYGDNGNDTIYGGTDDDYIVGGAGNDTLYGDAGIDVMYGGDGNDIMRGGAGQDSLNGGDGDDILYGDGDRDGLLGGLGADTFVFEASTAFTGLTFIKDFSAAQGDKLDISDILSGFTIDSNNISDYLLFSNAGGNSYLWVDMNGTASGGKSAIGVLTGITGLDVDTLYGNGNIIA